MRTVGLCVLVVGIAYAFDIAVQKGIKSHTSEDVTQDKNGNLKREVDEYGNVQEAQIREDEVAEAESLLEEGEENDKDDNDSEEDSDKEDGAEAEGEDSDNDNKEAAVASLVEEQAEARAIIDFEKMTSRTAWTLGTAGALAFLFTAYHCIIYHFYPFWKREENSGEKKEGEEGAPAEGAEGAEIPDNISEDLKDNETEEFEENVYAATTVCLIKDVEKLYDGTGSAGLRMTRIAMTILLQFFNIGLQIFLLYCLKMYVMRKYTTEIRDLYFGSFHGPAGPFENDVFSWSKWETWTKTNLDDAKSLCELPLSQPGFFYAILTVWAATILKELRQTYTYFDLLVMKVPTIGPEEKCTKKGEEPLDVIIVGLTGKMKAALIFLVYLPKFFIASLLLWMGSRWLCATPSFSDLILNAVALEFILLVDDLIYEGILNKNQVRDVQHTTIIYPHASTEPTVSGYMFEMIWLVFSLLWGWIYMYHMQQVLGDYKFDVNEPCSAFLESMYSLD